ncbi:MULTISPECIES: collagen-like triple helix repeat-containing protein [Bizionia]|uniref:Collagen-like protein n=1 Tax=Bizionia algoritergicola TaxID=291187 RepID=A0A5D0QP43_9FLAO|nr:MULTISPECIES: collagen-like protein [Bizionia]OBX18193.1 hypothetical protein BAA08_15575 [Bizionia sp. APA-3]TYB70635.1 collagen-like protein [Bizionia algoritergicola]
MKTQTIMSKTKFVLLAFLVAFSFSCSTEDGNDGAPGAEGPQGPAGTDGNANIIVKTVIPDPGPYLTWTVGSYLGNNANVHAITDTDISQDVLDNSMIVVYFQLRGRDTWYPMTYSFVDGSGSEIITFTTGLNNLTIYAYTDSGVLNAVITKVKYYIIDSSNNKTQSIDYTKMSYEEIMNHFDLN